MLSSITFTNEVLVIKYNSYNNTFHRELSPPILLRMYSILTYLLYTPCPTAHVQLFSRHVISCPTAHVQHCDRPIDSYPTAHVQHFSRPIFPCPTAHGQHCSRPVTSCPTAHMQHCDRPVISCPTAHVQHYGRSVIPYSTAHVQHCDRPVFPCPAAHVQHCDMPFIYSLSYCECPALWQTFCSLSYCACAALWQTCFSLSYCAIACAALWQTCYFLSSCACAALWHTCYMFPVLLRMFSIVTDLLLIPCLTRHVWHWSRPIAFPVLLHMCSIVADLLFPVLCACAALWQTFYRFHVLLQHVWHCSRSLSCPSAHRSIVAGLHVIPGPTAHVQHCDLSWGGKPRVLSKWSKLFPLLGSRTHPSPAGEESCQQRLIHHLSQTLSVILIYCRNEASLFQASESLRGIEDFAKLKADVLRVL
jgi:hypothetical protein